MKTMPAGTLADTLANVDINKVANGVFSSHLLARKFVKLGMEDIFDKLNKTIAFADVGGAEGFLTQEVLSYLTGRAYNVEALVIDANKKYLEKAKRLNLKTWLGDIKTFRGINFDLALMRSVNHYNSIQDQKIIFAVVYNMLRKRGYFINQILSANDIDCRVVSQILNFPSLGRSQGKEEFYVTSINEYCSMLEDVGFNNIEVKGIISTYSWHPEASWTRFNQHNYQEAARLADWRKVEEIENRKNEFLARSYEIIERHVAENKSSEFTKYTANSYEISLKFPLVRATK